MKLNISDKHFLEIVKQGYSLDSIYLLRLLHEGNEIDSLCREHEKISLMRQTLIRKHLISEDGHLYPEGQDLVNFLDTKLTGKIVKKAPVEENDKFLEFWTTYPSTNAFTYKGKTFAGDRALRVRKDECKLKFEKILAEGEYNADDIINALKLEINSKMESSLKENTNKLKYMQNSLTWFNQRTFEAFVEMGKIQKEITQVVTNNGVDI